MVRPRILGPTKTTIVSKAKSSKDENNNDRATSPLSNVEKNSTSATKVSGGRSTSPTPITSSGEDGTVIVENDTTTGEHGGVNDTMEASPSANDSSSNRNSNEGQGESSTTPDAETSGVDLGDDHNEEGGGVPEKKLKLYKSPRFKGYLTVALSSTISYHAANISQDPSDLTVVPSSDKQKAFAQTVAMGSAIVSGACVLCHIDAFSCLKGKWKQLFAPQSKFEVVLLILLLLWWAIATIIQTGVRGIAGDGKEQYNLYYSIWSCLCVSMWTLESKMTEYGWPTIKVFVKSWPYRAPGWISIFVIDFFTLFWYVDIYINTAQNLDRVDEQLVYIYSDIKSSHYEWLLFVSAATLLPSMAFIFVEIFRDSSTTEKPAVESYAEGVCLLLLTFAWIPSVIVATTPGGFAAVIGNSYFFTWATTIFVIETAMWFVHDSRWQVHQALAQKEQEYRKHQEKVLEQTLQIQAVEQGAKPSVMAQSNAIEEDDQHSRGDNEGDNNDVDDEEEWPQLAPIARGGRGMHRDDSANNSFGLMDDGTDSMDDKGGRMAIRDINQMGGATTGFVLQSTADDNYDNLDDSIRQEIRMKETNRRAYFDTLDDILE